MREPSIHITESKLAKVLESVLSVSGSPIKWDYKGLAKEILLRGKSYTLQSRKLLENNEKAAQRLHRIGLSTRDDAAVFANTLLMVRRRLKHKGLTLWKPESREWSTLKEITSLANSFCGDFELTRERGYVKYCEIALSKMQKFSLLKFASLQETITREYESLCLINQDTTPHITQALIDYYNKLLVEAGGTPIRYDLQPDKQAAFIKVVKEAKSLKVRPSLYVMAQFEGLAWAKRVPDPLMMLGEKAIERLNAFRIKNPEKFSEQNNQPSIDYSKLKKNHDKNPRR